MQKFWFGAAAVLAGVAVLAGCGRKDANALRLGTDAKFPPFEMRGGATGADVVGFDVDVARAIAANAGKKLKIVEMDGARLLPALADVDAVRHGRVYCLREHYITVPGPRFILVLERFARLLHPELCLVHSEEAGIVEFRGEEFTV